MEMDEEVKALRARMSSLSDKELLTIVEVEAADYREDAVEFAKAELLARGIEFDEGPEGYEESGEEPSEEELEEEPFHARDTQEPPLCSVCGGRTRFGILFAGGELTFLSLEDRLERAVEAYACRRCGRVQLMLQWDTVVERDPVSLR